MRAEGGLSSNALITIAPWGDSITAGYGSIPGGIAKNCGYRYLLWKYAQDNGARLQFIGNQTLPGPDAGVRQPFHGGIAGDTISAVTGRILTWRGLFPEVVCLMIGANDVMQQILSAQQMADQLDTAILTAWNVGQRPCINRTKLVIVAQIPDVYTESNVSALHQTTSDYNAKIPGIVSGHVRNGRNVICIDLYTPLGASNGSNPNFNPSSMPHPSDAGYQIMAPIWFGKPGSGLICDLAR